MFVVKSLSPDPLYRWRNQLGGCILLAALLPYIVRWLTLSSTAFLLPLHVTLAGSIAAIFFGTWLFRSITTYPGAEASSYILPVFSLAYGALAMAFVVARLDYNIPLLLAGYFISLAWFFWLVAVLRRRQALRIGVVAMGNGQQLPNVHGIHWISIANAGSSFEGLDAVTTDLRQNLPDEWDRTLTDLALTGVPVYHFKHLAESLTGRVELEHLSENSFGSLSPISAYMSIKHGVDWVVALVAGVVLLPVLLAIALGIKFSSSGPALFRQTRVGYRGRRFTVYKFRTMRILDQRDADGRKLAMTQADDSRIYPLGRILRKTRLDELPQIINVLRGEMSWIGPRPEVEVLSEWYEREIPFYRYRHIVRPGIAGWAQVCQGHVVEVEDVRSKLHYDFYYIKNYSLWLDLLIAMKTVRIMLTGHGSK